MVYYGAYMRERLIIDSKAKVILELLSSFLINCIIFLALIDSRTLMENSSLSLTILARMMMADILMESFLDCSRMETSSCMNS